MIPSMSRAGCKLRAPAWVIVHILCVRETMCCGIATGLEAMAMCHLSYSMCSWLYCISHFPPRGAGYLVAARFIRRKPTHIEYHRHIEYGPGSYSNSVQFHILCDTQNMIFDVCVVFLARQLLSIFHPCLPVPLLCHHVSKKRRDLTRGQAGAGSHPTVTRTRGKDGRMPTNGREL